MICSSRRLAGGRRNRGLGPRWYPIALAVLAIPQCWVGGKLYELRAAKRRAAATPAA